MPYYIGRLIEKNNTNVTLSGNAVAIDKSAINMTKYFLVFCYKALPTGTLPQTRKDLVI